MLLPVTRGLFPLCRASLDPALAGCDCAERNDFTRDECHLQANEPSTAETRRLGRSGSLAFDDNNHQGSVIQSVIVTTVPAILSA